MCADFQYYLNRTGPRGPQGYKGDKGDDGTTPVPRTGTNTPIETTVIFDTGDGNPYETPNLKYPIEDRGGNVVMLDRVNETQYYGTPDSATDDSYGVVKLATPESVLDDPLDSDVVTYELFDDNNQTIKAAFDDLAGDITQLNTNLGTEVTNRTNADTQLTNKINTDVGNEATARTNADNALSGRIDNLTTSKADKSDVYTKTQTDSLLNNKSNVGHTHNYNDLTNKPTIGNGTITITQGGVSKGTFTTNQSGNTTIALDAGGGGGSTYTAGSGIDITSDVISVDNTVVRTSGAQSIAGYKTFTSDLGIETDVDPSLILGITGTNCNVQLVNKGGSAQPRFILSNIGSSYQRFEVVDENLTKIGDLAYTSDIPTVSAGVLKKTITQASANVSLVGSTVTVADADVTTSTLVSLYPGDATTETWLSNNISSAIITEGNGSFTFDITAASLPSTFSMYYTVTEVNS